LPSLRKKKVIVPNTHHYIDSHNADVLSFKFIRRYITLKQLRLLS